MSYVCGFKARDRRDFCTRYKHDLMQILGVSAREASRLMVKHRIKKHVKYDSFILTGDPAYYIFKMYYDNYNEKYYQYVTDNYEEVKD